MKRVKTTIEINAPARDIWAAFTNPAGFSEWITGTQSVEVLTEGDYGVGTRYHVTAGRGDRTVEWTVEITGVVAEHRIDFTYTGDVEGNGSWLIEPKESGGGYRVTSVDEFAPPGGRLLKLLSKFWLDNAARAARRESLEQLKEIVETKKDHEAEVE